MFSYSLPKWIESHLYTGKDFSELTVYELETLRTNIKHFQSQKPDVSIVIPAWNEEHNIFRTLSSLAANKTDLNVEIVVINNNSNDGTQRILDDIGVISYLEKQQGITYARQLGLESAKGIYHLCADSDTFYPPKWIDHMVSPMMKDKNIVGVYGRYSFLPPNNRGTLNLWFYEKLAGLLIRLRKKKREYINFLGFNMGFVRTIGLKNGGFAVENVRKFDNAKGSDYFVDESEDGRMAIHLMKSGSLKLITAREARVYTSSRRLIAEGGIVNSFKQRFSLHTSRLSEYLFSKH